MRPKLVELTLVVGLGKWGVLVAEMASKRNSAVILSFIVNRLSRFMSKSNKLGPFQFETRSIVPTCPNAEFSKRILPLFWMARSVQRLCRLYWFVMELQNGSLTCV